MYIAFIIGLFKHFSVFWDLTDPDTHTQSQVTLSKFLMIYRKSRKIQLSFLYITTISWLVSDSALDCRCDRNILYYWVLSWLRNWFVKWHSAYWFVLHHLKRLTVLDCNRVFEWLIRMLVKEFDNALKLRFRIVRTMDFWFHKLNVRFNELETVESALDYDRNYWNFSPSCVVWMIIDPCQSQKIKELLVFLRRADFDDVFFEEFPQLYLIRVF